MARTASKMMPLGTIAPGFRLPDTRTGKVLSLEELRGGMGTLVMFICNHCPYVKHVNAELLRIAADYIPEGISVIAISANDAVQYPEDSPDKMKEVARELGYTFPYLFDETQEVARLYDAACTPDFFLFDNKLECVYRGQLDDSRPGNGIPLTGKDLREAMDCLLEGRSVPREQVPSLGCNIKWKQP